MRSAVPFSVPSADDETRPVERVFQRLGTQRQRQAFFDVDHHLADEASGLVQFAQMRRRVGRILHERGFRRVDAAGEIATDRRRLGIQQGTQLLDMPGDGLRYVRDSIGVDTVVVNGQVAWAKGAYSGAASGDICALN